MTAQPMITLSKIEIVGVVRNHKSPHVDEEDVPFAYQPYLQDARLGELTFYLRTQSDPKTGIFATGTALMAAVALAAALPPAMRAARTDALDALRSK